MKQLFSVLVVFIFAFSTISFSVNIDGVAFASRTNGQGSFEQAGGQANDRQTENQTDEGQAGGQANDRQTENQTDEGQTGGQANNSQTGGQANDRQTGNQTDEGQAGGQANDRQTGGQTNDSTGGDPAETPEITTIAKVRDVLSDDEDWSTADANSPAMADLFDDQIMNDEAWARIVKEEKEVEAKAAKQAKKEARALAKELVKNGRYKELIGYNSRYEKDYIDDEDYGDDPDDYDEEDEDYEDEEDGDYDYDTDDVDDEDYDDGPDNVHSTGKYYGKLKSRYPMIDVFWFEKNGKYHYEYYPDYDGINYDDLYHHVNHDTFSVRDTVEYKGLKPAMRYIIEASLVLVGENEPSTSNSSGNDSVSNSSGNDSTSNSSGNDSVGNSGGNDNASTGDSNNGNSSPKVERIIKTINKDFVTAEDGKGTLELDFGDLKLDAGQYVILMTISSEDGSQVIEHQNTGNVMETILVDGMYPEFAAKASNSKKKNSGDGMITFSGDGTPNTGDSANATVPAALILLISACAVAVYTRRRQYRR